MAIKLIPAKNVLLEEEKLYLDRMLERGLILRKKGLIFYYFNNKSVESLTNLSMNILLVNSDEDIYSLNVSDARILVEKNYQSSNEKLIYSLNDKGFRWLSEETSLLAWYKARQRKYLTRGNLFGFLGMLLFVLAMTPFLIPSVVFLLTPLFLTIAIPNLRKSDFCFEGSKNISYELGRMTGFEAEYILSFSTISSIDLKELEKEISSLGYFKKVAKDIYKIKTPLSKDELIGFIMESGNLKSTDFSIIHLGELYVM